MAVPLEQVSLMAYIAQSVFLLGIPAFSCGECVVTGDFEQKCCNSYCFNGIRILFI